MNDVATDRSPFLLQSWQNLLFLHWKIEPGLIQEKLPEGLEVDTYQGNAYLGVVPFYMHALRPRFCPPFPGISYFPELNLRTYVRDRHGRRGVWFFSLDAHSWISVQIARSFFGLPYRYATMDYAVRADKTVRMHSQHGDEPEQRFIYKPAKPIGIAREGSLEDFLVERYRFFSASPKGQIYLGELTHEPYELLETELTEYSKELFQSNGFATPEAPPIHVVYSPGVEVRAFAIRKITL
ncbi:MAG: DUF2071 domain-containing protein [Verrucomicrobiota bacterium]